MTGCNSCNLQYSFGRKNPQAAKAMRLWRSGLAKDLKDGWAIVKGEKKIGKKRASRKRSSRKRVSRKRVSRKRVSRKRVSRKRVSRKRSSRKRSGRKRSGRKRSGRKRVRRGRRFGNEGYVGQTSYSNAFAPYFGASESFVNPPEFFLPQTNGQIQSPQMLMTRPLAGYSGPGN